MDSRVQRPFLSREAGLHQPGFTSIPPQRSFLQSLSVRAKLASMIALSIISLAGLGIFFFTAINEVKVSGPIYVAIAREMDLRSDILPPPEFIVETHLTVLQIAKALRTDPKQIDALVKKIDGLKHDFDDRQSYWKNALPSETPLEMQIRDGILKHARDPAIKYFQILYDQFLPAVKRGDDLQTNTIIDTQLAPLYIQHKAAIESLADLTEKSQSQREGEAKGRIASRITLLIVISVISLLLSLSVGLYIISSITGPLQKAVAALRSVAGRDLTPQLTVVNDDELGAMATAFNTAMSAIKSGFGDAGDIANTVSDTSVELETAAKQLSDGTQSQASSLEETSASLAELTATVKQTAENAILARDLSSAASRTASQGIEVIDSAMRAMDQINAASVKIGQITVSIDEIAFHTNILAVNAAIEAARAGDLGGSFAVVASEVRTLAQRSAASAREINHLIKDTVAKVEYGSTQVNRSAETLGEIVKVVKQVAEMVSNIANACSEQSLAINNVNIAVGQVDQVTQLNAAQSEELFSTSRQLLATSAQLEQMVGSFDIGRKGSADISLPGVAEQAVSFNSRPVRTQQELVRQ
jgi:methyl-accepting chemotaxis protein